MRGVRKHWHLLRLFFLWFLQGGFVLAHLFQSLMWCSRWGNELCARACVCARVCGCSGEVFFPPTTVCTSPFYLCRSWEQKKKQTAAVVDFFSPRLNFKDVEAPRRAVCNECRFFFVRTVLFIPKQKKKKGAILFETTVIIDFVLFCLFFIKAPTVAWCLQPSV